MRRDALIAFGTITEIAPDGKGELDGAILTVHRRFRAQRLHRPSKVARTLHQVAGERGTGETPMVFARSEEGPRSYLQKKVEVELENDGDEDWTNKGISSPKTMSAIVINTG